VNGEIIRGCRPQSGTLLGHVVSLSPACGQSREAIGLCRASVDALMVGTGQNRA
jgi:hypothetical protein